MDSPGEGKSMDKTDARVQDPLVLDEIELYGDLVIAASSSDKPLSQAEIDLVLGLAHESSEQS
jgi:type IV pilus biogenesis protein CpaD/CtpE